MSAIITPAGRISLAKQFLNNLSTNRTYFFAAKADPWTNEVGEIDETIPSPASVDILELNKTRKEIFFMKKATSAGGILGLKRYNWTSGSVYTPWNSWDDFSLERSLLGPNSPFYVLVWDTSVHPYSYNVYMCLENNNGSPSTEAPTGKNIDPFTTPDDNYRWQFMYDIHEDLYPYISDILIPCPMSDDQKTETHLLRETAGTLTPGTIQRIVVLDGGSGYTTGSSVIITGNGTGAEARVNASGGVIQSIDIINPGSGYTEVELSFSAGTGADVRPVISPVLGHSSNVAEQLCATHAITIQTFSGSEGGMFPEMNSFRKIGLIKDIKDNNDVLLTGEAYSLFDQLKVTNISVVPGAMDKIIGNVSGAEARVFYDTPEGSTSTFFITNRVKDFRVGETVVVDGDYTKQATITEIINNDIDRYSGDIIYVENLQFIKRKLGQAESFIFSIEF